MNVKEYSVMENFEKTFWWHRGRLYLVAKLIEKYVNPSKKSEFMEIGCGTGETVKLLNTYAPTTGIDISEVAVNFCKSKGLKNIYKKDIQTTNTSPWAKKFDAIFALDVLEHVQDDVTAMKKVHEMLKRGGKFIISVPAHKFLWSEHDEALHHKRRYHSVELTQKLKDAGFKIEKKSYFVMTAFFPIILIRYWNHIFKRSAYPKTSYVELPPVLNMLALGILKVESLFFRVMKLPIGTTLVVVAKKQ